MRCGAAAIRISLFASLLLCNAAYADSEADIKALRGDAVKMERAEKWAEAAVLYERALELSIKTVGENHMTTAQILNSFGLVFFKLQKYDSAEPLFRRSIAIREKLKGAENIDVAIPLVNLANLYQAQEKFKQSETLQQRGLMLREKTLGEEHPDVASSLYNLGNLYSRQKNFGAAEPCYRRSLSIREKAFGGDHEAVAEVLRVLGNLYADQGKAALAKPLYERCLAINERRANVYSRQGQLREAEQLYARVLAMQEKLHGKEHLEVARALYNLAIVHGDEGKYRDASQLLERALAIREKALGADDPKVAECLNNLALFDDAQGRFGVAAARYERSLAILEKANGKEHISLTATLINQAITNKAQGKLAEAAHGLERTLRIQERELGNDHPAVAGTLLNLANIYKAQGKEADAEALFRRGLDIERASGKNPLLAARCLASIADLYSHRREFVAAEPLFKESLAIFEKFRGKDHFEVAITLNSIANMRNFQGKHAEAEALFLRSLAINEAFFGKDHREVCLPLINLANLYKSQGKYAEAKPLYVRCLANMRNHLGNEHPDVARLYHLLACLSVNQGLYADAVEWETQLWQSTRQFLLRELPTLSARDQENFLKGAIKQRFTVALSLGYRRNADPQVAEGSASWLLNGKAIAMEAQTMRGRLEQEISDADGVATLSEIKTIRSREASLAFMTNLSQSIISERKQLETRRLKLEKSLAPRSIAAAKLAQSWVELEVVRRSVPSKALLVDIARIRIDQFDPRTELTVFKPARYLAWLIPPFGGGEVHLVDLGDAARIDSAVHAARLAIENTPERLEKRESERKLEAELGENLGAVAKLVLEPLKPYLGGVESLIVSPDGDLWLLPWAALPLANDRYLIESFDIRLLVTGRDLINYGSAQRPETTPPLILADPDYNLTPGEVALATPSSTKIKDRALTSQTRGALDDLRGIGRVKRLPGTAAEARQAFEKLKRLTGEEPRLYSEAEASENIVKSARSPRMLVLATHGFFLKPPDDDAFQQKDTGAAGPKPNEKKKTNLDNPLLRCGLLLAGANKRASVRDDEDDGVLTGLEIVSLDLRGTQLVVLSACETGVGDVQAGEGVAGLRQAFQLAGAESVLATLWQISDTATGQLMNTFYDELAAGNERSQALARAQRQFIKNRRERAGAAHPFFWASFALTGK